MKSMKQKLRREQAKQLDAKWHSQGSYNNTQTKDSLERLRTLALDTRHKPR